MNRQRALLICATLALGLALLSPSPAGATSPTVTPRGGPPPSWVAHNPIRVLGPVVRPAVVPNATAPPFNPAQIRKAYGIDQLAATGTGKTIAIIDAYGSPSLQADFDVFNQTYGLPALTLAIHDMGSHGNNTGWAEETTLDVEWAHAIAPGANILVVVATSASGNDLLAAVDYANSNGASVVSMSWGGPEFSGEQSADSHFSQAGVTYFAASGDSGAGAQWPAVSAAVIGVGGTTLTLNADGSYKGETAWNNSYGASGGGISFYISEPSYQTSYLISNTLGMRGVPDVAFDADRNTGVYVYYSGNWYQVGGTSLSAPCWAGLAVLGTLDGPSWVYSRAKAAYAANYHDITSGSNGGYSAGSGYDLVTGLGTPIANYLVPGPATNLAFSVQPSATNTAGIPFSTQPVVAVLDASGNTVTSSNATITLTIGTNPGGGTLAGATTVAAANGVASFTGLSINAAGTGYTLTATSSGFTSANSMPFNVGAAPAGLLRVQTAPAVPTTISLNGSARDDWGVWVSLPAGNYTLSFSNVFGYQNPTSVSVSQNGAAAVVQPLATPITIVASQSTNVVANFTQLGNMHVGTSPPVPGTIFVNGTPLDDWGLWTEFPAGSYNVSFGNVNGYNTPLPTTAAVTAGATTTIIGTYTANATATYAKNVALLRVQTSPAVPSTISVNGTASDDWGLNWVELPAGNYPLSFSDVFGFKTPASVQVSTNGSANATQALTTPLALGAGNTYVVTATFAPRGNLRVLTTPAVPATISVNGQPMDNWGFWTELDPGSYTVSFQAFPGYVTPSPITVTVSPGATTQVTGNYSTGVSTSP